MATARRPARRLGMHFEKDAASFAGTIVDACKAFLDQAAAFRAFLELPCNAADAVHDGFAFPAKEIDIPKQPRGK